MQAVFIKVGRQGYGEDVGGWGLASASQRRCFNRPGSHLEEEERETIKLHPSIFSCVVLQVFRPNSAGVKALHPGQRWWESCFLHKQAHKFSSQNLH